MQWFDVDKAGLAKLLERKGKQFILYELLQNAWDENTTRVDLEIARISNSPYVTLTVQDDNPNGFADLSHAFTLFAESNKKGDAEKRGRFNLGEKLVLSMCRRAEIKSTKGTVVFDENGRRKLNSRTVSGSIFTGELKLTAEEVTECDKGLHLLIPPPYIRTSCSFSLPSSGWSYALTQKAIIKTVHNQRLPIEIADEQGILRRSSRVTDVNIYGAVGQAHLYEMGIPVVEIDGKYHADVQQKVPLNFDRDNVRSSYLATIHALVLEATRDQLIPEDANQSWVKVAIQERGDSLSDDTVRKVAELRFGAKRVIFDPSDPEANNIAASQGYTVVNGNAMSKEEWKHMRHAEAILPAGKVTPSRPDATVPRVTIAESEWTIGMRALAVFCKELAPKLIGVDVRAEFFNNSTVSAIATYGSRTISFNVGRLGKKWFSEAPLEKVIALVIHEFAHEVSGNHLSEKYYDALTDIGAKMVALALGDSNIFNRYLKTSGVVLA